jgi:hypothetical protein
VVGNIARIVGQFKRSWSQELEDDAIVRACVEAGHIWRERELGPVATVKMFLLQILFGNVACEFVPHLAGKDVTGQAYCAARGRLPLEALQMLLTRCTARMAECVCDMGLWLGHRLSFSTAPVFPCPTRPRCKISLVSREDRCHSGHSTLLACQIIPFAFYFRIETTPVPRRFKKLRASLPTQRRMGRDDCPKSSAKLARVARIPARFSARIAISKREAEVAR